jgi:hypothetical protein
MKEENIRAVTMVGGIAAIGWLFFIGLQLLSYALFPTFKMLPDVSSITDRSSVTTAFVYMRFLHEIVPGFVVGVVLGGAAAVLLPQRGFSLLVLPSVIVFVGGVIQQQMSIIPDFLIQRDWNWLFTDFLPMWMAFFIGTASAVAIVRKRKLKKRSTPPRR